MKLLLIVAIVMFFVWMVAVGPGQFALARADQRKALAQILDRAVRQGMAHSVRRGGVPDNAGKRQFHGTQNALFDGMRWFGHGCSLLK